MDEALRVPFPRRRAERLAGLAADDHDRRFGLLGDRGSLRGGVADEDERARGSVDLVAVDREGRPAARNEVELLVPSRPLAQLVVVLDEPDPGLLGDVRVDAERLDVEVRPHHRPGRSVAEPERELADVRGPAHAGNSGSSRSQSKSESSAAYSFAFGSSSIARRQMLDRPIAILRQRLETGRVVVPLPGIRMLGEDPGHVLAGSVSSPLL